jgi:hypothetical protein
MKFPGKNTLKMSEKAIRSLIQSHLVRLLGTDVRVIEVAVSSYGGEARIEFTSDPEVAEVPKNVDSVSAIISVAAGTLVPMEDPL